MITAEEDVLLNNDNSNNTTVSETKGETKIESIPPAPSSDTNTSAVRAPNTTKPDDEYGSYLNDPLTNPNIDKSVYTQLKWATGYAGVGSVTKTFNLESPLSSIGEKLKIKLQHNCITSKLVIFIGSEQVWEGSTTMHVANALAATSNYSSALTPENRTFFFGKGTKGMLFFYNESKGLLPTPSAFKYAFWVDEKSPIDEATQISGNDAGKDFKVWVPRADVSGDGITWYRVDTKRLGTGTEVAVHRRFRDFHHLHSQLGSYFKGSHLYNSLPRPPPKGIKIVSFLFFYEGYPFSNYSCILYSLFYF